MNEIPAGRSSRGWVLAATMFLAFNAFAQEADTQKESDEGVLEEVVVTGTRIVRDGYNMPTPVTVVSSDDLLDIRPSNLPDALNTLPQFDLSFSPQNNPQTNANQPIHGNILNLRGVGGIRTLILQDSIRVPPTTFQGTVDTNTIPQLLIDRVEIVTAGASAAYGSDAISGVVNFVIDHDFTGYKAVAQYGISSEGDFNSYRIGLAGGNQIGDNGHLIWSAEHYDNDGLSKYDRPYLSGPWVAAGSVVGGGTPGTQGNPLKFYNNAGFYIATFGGLINPFGGVLAGTTFTNPGEYKPVNPGTPTGTGGFYTNGDYYYVGGDSSLISPITTDQFYTRFQYDLSDKTDFFIGGTYSQGDNSYAVLPNLTFNAIFSGNAFLPPELQAQLDAAGAPAVTFAKSYLDIPLPHAKENFDSYNIIGGFEGQLDNGYVWNATYVYGKSNMDMAQSGLLELVPFAAALDAVRDPATGNIVCNASLNADPTIAARYADCVPFNPFGVGATSPEAVAYATGTSRYSVTNDMNDFSATLSGDLVDLWAGPLSFAIGAEYRSQSMDLTSNADPAVALDVSGVRGVAPTTPRFFLTNVGVAHGTQNVKEAFVELAMPLIVDKPFAKNLDINGAYRYADYKTSGGVSPWKIGGTWSPIDDLTFRITKSSDIRAPTLYDLYAGEQFNIQGAFDPQTGVSGSLPTRTGGNPDLKPEIGDTLTWGIVWQPTNIAGLRASVDFWDLKITDAITLLSAQGILNDCYNTPTSPSCDLINRDDPDSFPNYVRVAGANIAKLETSGVDIEASYSTDLGDGIFGLRGFATYVDKYQAQNSSTEPVIELAGYTNIAKWKWILQATYSQGPWGLFVQERYIGKITPGSWIVGLPESQQVNLYAEPDLNPVWYTDLTASYTIPVKEVSVDAFLTISNLFDKDPPLYPQTAAPGLVYATQQSVYDIVGRAFTFGVRLSF